MLRGLHESGPLPWLDSWRLLTDISKIHRVRWSAIPHLGEEIRAALRGEKLSLSVVWDVKWVAKTTSFTELPSSAVNFPKRLEGHTLCSHTLKWTVIKLDKIGNVYSLEYTDISKVFFMSQHVGHRCINVIRGHCCALGHSCTDGVRDHYCTTLCCKNDLFPVLCNNVSQEWPWSYRLPIPVGKTRQTDMDGPIV
jgi:hypothetical protein